MIVKKKKKQNWNPEKSNIHVCIYIYICLFLKLFLLFYFSSQMMAVYAHLNEVSEDVVDVGSFRQKKATTWTNVIKEEQVLVLQRHVHILL